jgi:hypothetical protein
VDDCNFDMKNDIWEIVRRLVGKSVIDSKGLHKVYHATNGGI